MRGYSNTPLKGSKRTGYLLSLGFADKVISLRLTLPVNLDYTKDGFSRTTSAVLIRFLF